jgi:hypothetical protein
LRISKLLQGTQGSFKIERHINHFEEFIPKNAHPPLSATSRENADNLPCVFLCGSRESLQTRQQSPERACIAKVDVYPLPFFPNEAGNHFNPNIRVMNISQDILKFPGLIDERLQFVPYKSSNASIV